MANVRPLTPDEQADLNRLTEENLQIKERIRVINEKIATATGAERTQLESMMEQEKIRLKLQSEVTEQYKKRQAFLSYEQDKLSSLANLSKDTLKQIQGQAKEKGLLASVTTTIVSLKRREMNLEGEALQKSIARRETLEQLQEEVIAAGEAVSKAKNKEQSESEKIEKFERSIAHLTQKQKEEARDLFKIKTKLEEKERRIHALHEQMHGLSHSLPEGITSAYNGMVGLVKNIKAAGMAMAPLVIAIALFGAGLHAYMEMEQAAEDFRKEIGLTVRQSKEMYDVAHHTTVAYRGLGVTAKEALDTIKELKTAQSDMLNFSQSTVDALSIMNVRLGVSAKDSAEVVSMFEQMGGLSESAATSAALQAANISAKVGVSTKQVFADMSKSAGTLSKHLRGNVNLFVQQAVKARMLGTTLEGLTKTAENLLDFENSIEEELVAATFVGGQFNLTRARALAYEGKIAEANEEILNQIQKSGDFRKQDYFTQTQLAKAAGKTVEEITKELGVRDKLQSLNGEQLKNANALIDAGVDISNLSDKDIQKQAEALAKQERISAVMTDIQDKIAGIIEAVGGRLAPVFDVLGKVIYFIFDVLGGIANIIKTIFNPTESLTALFQKMGPLTSGIAVALTVAGTAVLGSLVPGLIRAGIAAAAALPAMISTAVAAITSASAATLGIGAIAIIGGITAAVAAMKSAQKVGDVMSPADGKTVVSTKEGGIYELSRNDDLVAAPGAAKALAGGGVQAVSPLQNNNNRMISALIQEFRGVREDMASGKIGVYMDNEKVTSNIGKTLDTSTRNKFALA